jgi:hypothetical protein
MHDEIARARFALGKPGEGRTRGITGLVYRTIRGTARVLGSGYAAALDRLDATAEEPAAASPRREAFRAALNGVVGDHLAATRNPLAIEMRLRREGRALALERRALSRAIPDARRRVVVLVHGLCLDDLCWQRSGQDPAALADEFGRTPLYLRYNSGRHVSTNGHELAALLERLVRTWPVPLERVALIGHSLGGLVVRSACHQAAESRLAWPRRLDGMIFLGTPHHGTPLALGGHWLHAALGVSPYTAPIARLARLRSAGITDLHHGSVLDADWEGRDRFALSRERPAHVPLPEGLRCLAVAGVKARCGAVLGDGLVPVDSALGRHRDPRRALAIPESRRWVVRGVGHLDLLGHPLVRERIRRFLAPGAAPG